MYTTQYGTLGSMLFQKVSIPSGGAYRPESCITTGEDGVRLQ